MWQLKIFFVTAILVLFSEQMDAKPFQDLSRPKRTSDQRLAELETLIALSKMNGKLVTMPIGFGKIDPNKLWSPCPPPVSRGSGCHSSTACSSVRRTKFVHSGGGSSFFGHSSNRAVSDRRRTKAAISQSSSPTANQ